VINELRNLIEYNEIDGILLLDQYEVLYTLGVKKSYNLLEINPVLLITDKKSYLISDRFTFEELKGLNDIEYVLIDRNSFNDGLNFAEKLKEVILKERIKKIGVFEEISFDWVKVIHLKNLFLHKFTLIDDERKERLKECIEIGSSVYSSVKENLSKFQKEIELRNFIDELIYENGAEKRAYPTRIVSKKRTSNPYSTTEGNVIEYPLIIDFGLLKGNIGIGISRTFFPDELRDLNEKIMKVREEILNYIKPGRICSKIYEHYLGIMKKIGFKDFIHHSLSKPLLPYSKGLYISPYSNEVIEPGYIFHLNIELYKPDDFGIKFIDVIEIRDKAFNLTDF